MLVLTRKKDEKLLIGDDTTITVIKIQRNKVLLGIDAPKNVSILRDDAKKKEVQME